MPRLWINGKTIDVKEGTTVLEAARSHGVDIPVLCSLPGVTEDPSCLVCVVKDDMSGRFLPACATLAGEGMKILTDTQDTVRARERALDLLAAEHAGDCEAPCRRGCPLFIDVDRALDCIKEGDSAGAAAVFLEHNPFPSIMGRLCTAPCQKVCRRGRADEAVAIRLLEQHAGDAAGAYVPSRAPLTGRRAAVVGGGPAGLSAAYHLARLGHEVTVFEKKQQIGGGLRAALGHDQEAVRALEREMARVTALGVKMENKRQAGRDVSLQELKDDYHGLVLAGGAGGENNTPVYGELDVAVTSQGITVDPETFMTSRPGVFAVGAAVRKTKQAVHALRQGREAALAMHAFLVAGKAVPEKRLFDSHLTGVTAEEMAVFMKGASSPCTGVPAAKRFSSAHASAEAARCLDCGCLKREDCSFRRAVSDYLPERRVRLAERPPFRRVDSHPDVVLEPGKCIACGRCVRITALRGEPLGLAFMGRGFDMTVGVPFGRDLKEALTFTAAECVTVCPTGALAFKKGKGKNRE